MEHNQQVCHRTMGLMKRSYLGGLRVKPSPTKHTFVTILFQAFFCLFPVLMTLSTSVSPWARTFGRGTSHLPCTKQPMSAFRNLCCFLTRVSTSWNKQQTANTYSFLLPFLFYHVGKDFSVGLSLSVQQVSWNCTLRSFVIIFLLGFPLFVHFDAIKSQICSYRTLFTAAKITTFFLLQTHVFFIWIFSANLCLW